MGASAGRGRAGPRMTHEDQGSCIRGLKSTHMSPPELICLSRSIVHLPTPACPMSRVLVQRSKMFSIGRRIPNTARPTRRSRP